MVTLTAMIINTKRWLFLSSSAAGLALAALLAWPHLAGPQGTHAIEGRLVLSPGADMSDWRVLATNRIFAELPRDKDGSPLGITPDADGTFALPVPDGATIFVCPYLGTRLAPDALVSVWRSLYGTPTESRSGTSSKRICTTRTARSTPPVEA
jgi:hypothetical protein